jgi:hypothetical protein
VTAEEENAPSRMILSLVTSPLYTGGTVYLGATTRGISMVRRAFPNAKRVVLKLPERIEPLEGGSGEITTQTHENYESSEIPDIKNDAQIAAEPADNDSSVTEMVADEILSEEPVTIPELIALGDPTTDIHQSIKGRFGEDMFFTLVLKDPAAYKNFEVRNGLIFLKDNGKHTLCVPDIMMDGRRVREMIVSHAHSILAHLGAAKTVTYLKQSVWWKGLVSDVQSFCDTCATCKTSKPSNQPPYGKLETLDIPT